MYTNTIVVPTDWSSLQKKVISNVNHFFYRFGKGILTGEDCEDTIQNASLKLHRSINSFDPSKGTFDAWVATIAKRCILDTLFSISKRRGLVTSSFLQNSDGEYIDTENNHACETYYPCDMEVVCMEIRGQIDETLSKLKDRDRRFYNMYQRGFKTYEIAASEGVNTNIVSISLSRTNEKIRQQLSYIAKDYGFRRRWHHTFREGAEYHTKKEIDEFEWNMQCPNSKKTVKKIA